MAIQKARLRELRRYARDKREEQHQRQRNEIQSLENYYKDQFNMLAETMAKERSDLTIRDKAQSKVYRYQVLSLEFFIESWFFFILMTCIAKLYVY